MFKKGLITLVCLTVMSALWSWAATTYSISTKINSLGTTASVVDGKTVYTPIVGGSIQVRDNAAHTTGIKYTNLTTSALVDVVVTPAAGYKVSALTKNGVAQAVAANQTAPVTVQVQKPSPIATQFVVATFAVAGDTAVVSKTWQLQLQNNNGGGKITYTRAGVSADYTTIGKLFAKNYIDTTPVTVTVTPSTGYNIDYLVVNGVKTFYGTDVAQVVNVDPAVGSRLKSVVAGYKKKSALVTTANIANGGGIAPLNPVADPYGNVRLVISPTGSSNVVTSVTSTGGVVTLTDRFGDPVTLPYIGAVKATITGITGPITVSATYGFDAANSGQYSGCTQTCHLNASVPQSVRDADTQWLGSAHRTGNVDCVSCHQTMPGPDYSTPAAKETLCATCHTTRNEHTAEANQCSVCHTFSGGHDPVSALNAGVAPQHFGGAALVKAQFVSKTSTCTSCHAGTGNAAKMAEYKASAHGDATGEAWWHYDWRSSSRNSCARCHTTAGFIAKIGAESNTTWIFTANDVNKAGETLACLGCHSNVADGTIRTVPATYTLPFSVMAGGGTNVVPDMGKSNICVRCHGGRASGAGVPASADFTANGRFPSPHYLTAPGTLGNYIGYHFAGQDYTGGYHKNVGGTTAGPCVTCHMSAGEGHTFDVVTKDASGHITGLTNTACVSCHGTFTAADVEAAREKYHAALDQLKAALATYAGAHYDAVTGQFMTTAGGTTQKTVYASKDQLGAAYNYYVLDHSDPAAYVHNRTYAYKLIADSIDILNDGKIDGDSGIVASHIAKTDDTNCASCHTGAAVPAKAAGTFVGSSTCQSCHSAIHNQWKESWHTLKAKKGPALLDGSLENINPWAQANWASLKTYQILGRKYNNSAKNYSEFWVSVDKKPITDVAIVIGQTRKQRYAVYFDGSAQRAKVVYSNNGGITYREKMVDHDSDPGTPNVWEEVDMPAQPDRAGYMFLWLEVQLDQTGGPQTNAHNYEEWRSWQERCTACHTTGFDRVAFNAAKADYVASFNAAGGVPAGKDMRKLFISEIEISCEACHGAAAGHAAINPATLDKSVPFQAHTRQMVCESCHTRTDTNRLDTAVANDRRGFVLGDATAGQYQYALSYTRPAWGTGNRQVSIDGKGRRDHQMTMDKQLSKYIIEEIKGKPSYHGNQTCFDCHKSHDVGLNGATNPWKANLQAGTYNMTSLKTSNPADTYLPRPAELRLKASREALCKSCHIDRVVPEGGLPAGLTIDDVPAYATIQALFNVFNTDTSPSGYGFPFDATLAVYNGDATALVANTLSNWGGQTSGGVGAHNGRGARKSHVFNKDASATNPNGAFGLKPEQYVWSVLTTNLGSTNAADYTAIWPWERTLPQYTTNRTIVYGPISGPPAPAP